VNPVEDAQQVAARHGRTDAGADRRLRWACRDGLARAAAREYGGGDLGAGIREVVAGEHIHQNGVVVEPRSPAIELVKIAGERGAAASQVDDAHVVGDPRRQCPLEHTRVRIWLLDDRLGEGIPERQDAESTDG
jgi:hypothetical protein